MDLQGKKVLVFGAGISGIGSCGLLEKEGAEVILYDGNDKKDAEAMKAQLGEGSKVRYLVLIGATKEQIQKEAAECGFHDCILKDTFEEALDTCVELARPGDAVLLSPACASWGMFPNYEVRGEEFKKYVNEL